MRSTCANMELDEFGRLIREGVSDSDRSESPCNRYERRMGRRYRSPSPGRRRRSPWCTEERVKESHRLSYRKRSSRSRSPVLWRYNEFTGDMIKFKKGECFNFIMGRCFRGASCRYSHNLTGNSGKLRYSRGRESYSPRGSRSPDLRKSKSRSVKEAKEGHDRCASDDTKVSNELPVSSANIDQEKLASLEPCSPLASDGMIQSNVSSSLAQAVPVRKRDSLSPGPHAQNLQISRQLVDKRETQVAHQDSHFTGALSMPSNFSVLPPLLSNNHLLGHVSEEASEGNWKHTGILNGSSSNTLVNNPTVILPSQSSIGYLSNTPDNGHAHSKDAVNRESQSRHPVQNLDTPHSSSFGQCSSALIQPSVSGSRSFQVGGPPPTPQEHPILSQTRFGMQGSAGIHAMENSRVTPYLCQSNQPDVKGYVGSGIPYNSYPSAPALNPVMSSEVPPNALNAGNGATGDTNFSAPSSFSYLPRDMSRSAGDGETLVSSMRSGMTNVDVSRQPGYDQYDPLLDSIEASSISVSRTNQAKQEAMGDSDDIVAFNEFGRALNMENLKEECKTSISVSVSRETEECAATADGEADAVLNTSTSNPSSDAIGVKEGEREAGRVKLSGRSKSKELRSTKLFKISIAAFVKKALKPSWRQGNMSKEAFKTIVKKTIDKVSGAMRKQKIPKSQAKIDRYIEASREKLTKLVMGYVEKYVKA